MQRRIDRLIAGNFGDSEYCRDGVWELRIDVGPGYRVYYAKSGASIVLLLCGGDKRTQDTDIKNAIQYWKTISNAVERDMANTKTQISHEEATIAALKRDPAFAVEYLNAVLADGDREELLLSLRRMAEAYGGVAALAEKADLNAKSLYRTLSSTGNPELKSLSALLNAMGMRLAVQPLPKMRRRLATV